jgi:hypothetical protein
VCGQGCVTWQGDEVVVGWPWVVVPCLTLPFRRPMSQRGGERKVGRGYLPWCSETNNNDQ